MASLSGDDTPRRKSEESDEEALPDIPTLAAQEIPFPDLVPGSEFLVPLFHLAGTATQTGMGLVPLSWQEIRAWAEVARTPYTPWELETIRRMSEAYVSEYTQASDRSRPMPYQPVIEEEQIDRASVAASVGSIFAALREKR